MFVIFTLVSCGASNSRFRPEPTAMSDQMFDKIIINGLFKNGINPSCRQVLEEIDKSKRSETDGKVPTFAKTIGYGFMIHLSSPIQDYLAHKSKRLNMALNRVEEQCNLLPNQSYLGALTKSFEIVGYAPNAGF